MKNVSAIGIVRHVAVARVLAQGDSTLKFCQREGCGPGAVDVFDVGSESGFSIGDPTFKHRKKVYFKKSLFI